MAGKIIGNLLKFDVYDGGSYKINGTVTGVTGSRQVRLIDRKDGRYIRKTWSVDGTYKFENIANREYIAYAIDYENVWNVAVADRCIVEAM